MGLTRDNVVIAFYRWPLTKVLDFDVMSIIFIDRTDVHDAK